MLPCFYVFVKIVYNNNSTLLRMAHFDCDFECLIALKTFLNVVLASHVLCAMHCLSLCACLATVSLLTLQECG